jgi:Cu/Zn superoxide dismutase
MAGALAACGSDAEDSPELGESLASTLTVTDAWTGVHPRATGDAEITSDDGIDVRLSVAGLAPAADYTAHLHDGACIDDPPGGGHWLADPSGEDAAGNIVALSFTTTADGAGSAEVSAPLELDDRATSIVVHASEAEVQDQGLDADRVLCGELGAG